MKKALVYLDKEDIQNSIELINVVNKIYKNDSYEIYAISFSELKEVLIGKVDCLFSIEQDLVKEYDVINITNVIEEIYKEYKFDTILIPTTYIGRMLAPRLAMRLKLGLVADVTDLLVENEQIKMIRPAFGGKIMAEITSKKCDTTMMTIRGNVFKDEYEVFKKTQIINYKPSSLEKSRLRILNDTKKVLNKDIKKSKVLVAGGGGVLENFDELEILAKELNGLVAASRKIVDSGKASRTIQVGQSGKIVSPKLYIALGIYGSLQHIEGLKNIENIISVNTNKNAPICSLSDIVIEGDAIEFMEKLTNKIKNNKI